MTNLKLPMWMDGSKCVNAKNVTSISMGYVDLHK